MHAVRRPLSAPFALVAFAAILAAGPAAGGARAEDAVKAELALKPAKGSSVTFQQSQSNVQSISTGAGPANEQSSDVEREWTQTADAVGDDGVSLQVKFGRFKGSASSMMGVLEFDSDEPADPANPIAGFSKVFTSLSGKSATVKIAKDGTVGDVKGLEGGDAPGGAPGGMGGMGGAGGGMTRGLSRVFSSPEAVKGWLRHKSMETPV